MSPLDLSERFDAAAAWSALHETVRCAIGEAMMNLLAVDQIIEHAVETDNLILARVGFASERRAQRALDYVLGEIGTVDQPLLASGEPRIPALLGPVCRACGCSEEDACAGGCGWAEADLCTACRERGHAG